MIDDWIYAIGFIALTLAIAVLSIVIVRKKVDALDLAARALVVWLPGTLAVTFLIPATSYLAGWSLPTGRLGRRKEFRRKEHVLNARSTTF